MKIKLAMDKLFEDKLYHTGSVVEVSDEAGAYHISMGSAEAVPETEPLKKIKKAIDKLDEAVGKDNPFVVGSAVEGDDHPATKKGKK